MATNLPLMVGGEISPMYMEERDKDVKANPPINREATKVEKVGASAEQIAEIK